MCFNLKVHPELGIEWTEGALICHLYFQVLLSYLIYTCQDFLSIQNNFSASWWTLPNIIELSGIQQGSYL